MTRNRAKTPSQRTLRVGELIRHVVSEILMRENLQSPVLEDASLTVTGADVSPDLRQATVYVMPLGGGDTEEVIAELTRQAGAIRGALGRRITLKFTPSLKFRIDPSFDEAERIESLLRQPHVAKDLSGGSQEDDDSAAERAVEDTEDAGRG